MALKNLLVSYNATEAAESALGVATDLARRHGAHLTGVLSYGPQELVASYASYLPAGVAEQLVEADRAKRREIETLFRARTAAEPQDRIHFLDVFGSADEGLMEVARTFDLVVMGTGATESEIPHMEPHPDVVARHSGRPVLVVPKGYAAAGPVGHALVAWDGGRAAARALADAMLILEGTGAVTVLTVGRPEDEAGLRDITRHLIRHGIRVTPKVKAREGRSIADTILDACSEAGAGLLVMGAYEHSKFAEDLFGGVTNTVLNSSHIPVLMSH